MDMFNRVDFSVPPSQRAGFSMRGEVAANLKIVLDPLDPLLEETTRTLLHTSRAYWAGVQDGARASIFNHAINDFASLIDRLLEGDGRNAARISRSLYEHLVNYCWVSAHEEAKERYVSHDAVTLDLIAKMRRGAMLLSRVQRKRELHRLKKIENGNRAKLRAVIAKYGSSFARDWSAVSLRERAEYCGFGSSYDMYRLLSQVTHGSLGGTLGTRRESHGLPVHRMGPSLELAVLSYPEGLSFFRDLCRRIQILDALPTTELVDAINRLIEAWPTYKNACEAVDRYLWPDSPPSQPMAILALYPQGGTRWFLWEPEFSVITPTLPPHEAAKLVRQAREHLNSVHPEGFPEAQDGKPITVSMYGVSLPTKSNCKWYPAESILQIPEAGSRI